MWHRQGNVHKTFILGYTAFIIEQEGHKFTVRIEDGNGTVLHDWDRDPVEFEEAERWVILSAVELEQTGDTDIAQKGMNQTLDLCEPLLASNAHPTHLQRLANIREWYIDEIREDHGLSMVDRPKPPERYPLEWAEREPNRFEAATHQGKVVIVENKGVKSAFRINPARQYEARIEHPSGAAYSSYGTFMDFVDAENWLEEILNQLDDPGVEELLLGSIAFTLNICRCSLPPDIDPVHPARLEYLEFFIGCVLL